MKYLEPFRDPKRAAELVKSIKKVASKKWFIMEICGGQTHSIVKNGLDILLPDQVEFIHGPGCPVCVTPLQKIDRALTIASQPNVIFCSFGDMLRVPGSQSDLLTIKARGGAIQVLYSPMDALGIAKENPDKEVVFFGVGFETTAPAHALLVHEASRMNLTNFSLLVSQVLVPPALEAILGAIDNRVQAVLAAGHVCTITGFKDYPVLSKRHRIPIVITGFEPIDILEGVLMAIQQLEAGIVKVENQYLRSVKKEGNLSAIKLMNDVFEVSNQKWRGIGEIKNSGLKLRKKYQKYDAETKFQLKHIQTIESTKCQTGLVLRGQIKPSECPEFGKSCTPDQPLGATMVSSEGACAAYFQYRGETNAGT